MSRDGMWLMKLGNGGASFLVWCRFFYTLFSFSSGRLISSMLYFIINGDFGGVV